jgi:transcriptional regulator with XRE-family HTH domain
MKIAEQKERFVELRAAGQSYAACAQKLGVSKTTLISWAKELSLQIQNARALRLDELFERFAVAKEKRIETFGRRLEAILAELDNRDLSGVKTEALLSLALKFGEHLRDEYQPLALQGQLTDLGVFDLQQTQTWQG